MAIDLKNIQKEHKEWAQRNFNYVQGDSAEPFYGAVEEIGELAHAFLKRIQKIRYTEEECNAKAKDAIGDLEIFILDVCNREGWDLEEIIGDTWKEVRERDWNERRRKTNENL